MSSEQPEGEREVNLCAEGHRPLSLKIGRGHIDRKYYSSKIIFHECVPVATLWSKHIHGNAFR